MTGLVGSRIVELLKDKYEFENISRSTGVDIANKDSILHKIESSNSPIILHLAAKTDVDGCEKDKVFGEDGEAWRINVLGTQNVTDACSQANKKLIYISTDFVFGGTKEVYFEQDIPNPINWYARTKYEGEKIVQKSNSPWVIARIAYPYRASFSKLDFFRAILNRFKKNEQVFGVTDHIFTPTFVDDIAFAIDGLIKSNEYGIFHAVGSQSLSPYDAAILIAKEFNLDLSKIIKTTRAQYFKNRASRPFKLALKNAKITKLGIHMRTFEEGIKEIKRQILY